MLTDDFYLAGADSLASLPWLQQSPVRRRQNELRNFVLGTTFPGAKCLWLTVG